MKKELIIVIIIVIAITILDTITHNYTKINFAKINEQLEQIKEISEDIYIMEKEQDIAENTRKENDNKPSKQEKLKEKIKTMEDRTLVCITAIEDCIAGLPNGLDEIIRKYYLQKMSLREMSKRFFLGRDAIARRRDKAIAIISDCLAEL